jgi:hypothetical protein
MFFGLDNDAAIAYKQRKNNPQWCGRRYVRRKFDVGNLHGGMMYMFSNPNRWMRKANE